MSERDDEESGERRTKLVKAGVAVGIVLTLTSAYGIYTSLRR